MFRLSHTHSVSTLQGTSCTVRHLALGYHLMQHTNYKVNSFERLHKSITFILCRKSTLLLYFMAGHRTQIILAVGKAIQVEGMCYMGSSS